MPLRSTAAASSGDSSSAGSGDRPLSSIVQPVWRARATATWAVMPRAPPVKRTTESLPMPSDDTSTGSVPGGRPCRRTISLVSRAPSRRPTSAGAPAAAKLLGHEAGADGRIRDLGLAQVDEADHAVRVLDAPRS